MELHLKQARLHGHKKMAVNNKSFIDNMREHNLVKKFSSLNTCEPCYAFHVFLLEGNDPNSQDSVTGETFLHILCDYGANKNDAKSTRIVYALATKIDLDIIDNKGDTTLHKIVLVVGSWRFIVAFMRCGACPFIRNKAGRTAEEEILFYKREGWEENLYWLRKFLPGLWYAVKCKNPDVQLIEKLLKYWCRTTKIMGREAINLKCLVHMCETQLDTVCMIEKYENTIELALAMMSGNYMFLDNWNPGERRQDVDINIKDYSFQYSYRDYPMAPRPLVAAVWEIDESTLVEGFMKLRPNLNTKYTFESQAASPPKPLFFHLVNPKMRPKEEAVTRAVLSQADLSVRNVHGQTLLMEAILKDETEGIIMAILKAGVDVAARDAQGRTARDLSDFLGRQDYKAMIDDYVLLLIKEKCVQKLEDLVLSMYDMEKAFRHKCGFLSQINCDQVHVKKLFSFVKAGNRKLFVEVINDTYSRARDTAGRSLLHYAIQCCDSKAGDKEEIDPVDVIDSISMSSTRGIILEHKQSPVRRGFCKRECYFKEKFCKKEAPSDHLGIIRYLVSLHPTLLHCTNNLGQTPLHYAHIYSSSPVVVGELERAGVPTQVKDVFDLLPRDYNKEECGMQTFLVRRKPTVDLHLDIFLREKEFEEKFQKALKSGDVRKVKSLIDPLLEHHGEQRFSNSLFDCLDKGHMKLASYLIQTGFKTRIFKQYKACDPDNPMCAMMECNHAVTSLRQRAVEIGAMEIVDQIDKIQLKQ